MSKRNHSPVSIEKTVEIYYKHVELGTEEIRELFGCSRAMACKYRGIVREYVAKNCDFEIDSLLVPTEDAYKAWGINITDYEKRLTKLQKFNLA